MLTFTPFSWYQPEAALCIKGLKFHSFFSIPNCLAHTSTSPPRLQLVEPLEYPQNIQYVYRSYSRTVDRAQQVLLEPNCFLTKQLTIPYRQYAASASPLPFISELASEKLPTPDIVVRSFARIRLYICDSFLKPPQLPAQTHAVSQSAFLGWGHLVRRISYSMTLNPRIRHPLTARRGCDHEERLWPCCTCAERHHRSRSFPWIHRYHGRPPYRWVQAYLSMPEQTSLIIWFSDCGALHFTDEQIRETIRKRGPNDKSVDDATFGAIKKYVLPN